MAVDDSTALDNTNFPVPRKFAYTFYLTVLQHKRSTRISLSQMLIAGRLAIDPSPKAGNSYATRSELNINYCKRAQ